MHLDWSTAVFLAAIAAYVGIRTHFQRLARGQRTVIQRNSGREFWLVVLVSICQVVLPLIFIFSPWLDRMNYKPAGEIQAFGLAPLVVGIWLFWRSHTDLGKAWSVALEIRANQKLVTTGVYRHIRHPMYAAFFLFAMAQGLLLTNWLAGWSALAAMFVLRWVRVPAEEAMMLGSFGVEYQSYMERTGAIIPRWRMRPTD